MYSRYYFLLSGEHETLPKAELRAILEAEKIEYHVIKDMDQVVLIETANSPEKIVKIIKRASMVKEAGILLGFHEAESLNQIRNSARSIDWSFLANRCFAVRAKRVKEYFPQVKSSFVEREIGALILSKEPSSKVNLSNPELIIRVLLTENYSVFGVKLAELDTKQFLKRKPRNRPFFHPGVLSPKISRLFVNLSRPRKGDLFLDPFCGIGGFIIEAYLLGLKCLCSELRWDLIRGAKQNFDFYKFNVLGVIQADATKIPWIKADAISTDPPYGRSTTTLGRNVKDIVRDFLNEASDIIKKNKYLVFALPHTVDPFEVIPSKAFELVEKHSMRVHKSLTRIIVVLKRR